jgi:magnesium-transporting ATPase (P-type)
MTNSRSGNVIEAFVTAESVPLEKKRDPESGLALIDPRSE